MSTDGSAGARRGGTLRRRLAHAARRLRAVGASQARPTLSVVIPVYNVEDYLGDCLDSILGQTLDDLEIIAVDDGSTDGTADILRRYAATDPRLTVVTQPNAGQGAARNTALKRIRGEFLTFCDSDDTVPRDAYAAMVRSLRNTGSDLVVGAARRIRPGGRSSISAPEAHARRVLATTIDEFPLAMHDIIACNRVFRTDFWLDRVGTFRTGIVYEDHVPMLTAYVRAHSFDVLPRVTYHWRIRDDRDSSSQQKADIQNLRDRIAVKQEAENLLATEASAATFSAWVGRCLDRDFPRYLRHALSGTADYRDLLSQTYRTFFDKADSAALASVNHVEKVRGWLCAIDAWGDLASMDRAIRAADGRLPVRHLDDGTIEATPPTPQLAQLVPRHLWQLADYETPLEAALRSASWTAPNTLTATGYAIVRGLGTEHDTPTLDCRLVSTADGQERAIRSRVLGDPESDRWIGDRNASYPHSQFVIAWDVDELASLAAIADEWRVEIELAQGAIRRKGLVMRTVPGSGGLDLLDTAHMIDAHRHVVAERSPEHGLVLRFETGSPSSEERGHQISDVRLVSDEVLVASSAPAVELTRLCLSRGATTVPPVGHREGEVRLPLRVPTPVGDIAPLPTGTWVLRNRDDLRSIPPSTELRARLPFTLTGERSKVAVSFARGDESLHLSVTPVVPDTAVAQQRLQQRYIDSVHDRADLIDTTFFVSSWHEGSQDTMAAHAAHDGVRGIWSVPYDGAPTPDGWTSVVEGSRAWYDAWRSSYRVVSDGEPPSFVRPITGQHHTRVISGPPLAPFGTHLWSARGKTPARIDDEIARRHDLWDEIVVPDAATAHLARDAYRFEGDITIATDPSHQTLSRDDDHQMRELVRTALGVPPEARLVLYAPATRSPGTVDAGLDLPRLLDLLPPDHYVVRLGYSHRRDERVGLPIHPRVHDLTPWPYVTEVMAACDVAILDYSAHIWRWTATQRPSVFFVPDRDRWFRLNPVPIAYDEIATGPQVTTVDATATALRGHGAARLASSRDEHDT